MNIERKPKPEAAEPSAEQVAEFLEAHPDFFELQAELVGKLKIPHPSGNAISLIEKQVDILRNQNRQLERRLVDLIEVARANEATVEKIHQLALTLLDAHDLTDILTSLQDTLRNRFNADHLTIGLFRGDAQLLEASPARRLVRDDLEADFANFLKTGKPQCGRLRPAQLEFLFGEHARQIGSAALIPLGEHTEIGLVAVGSGSEDQFSPTLGTLYLSRIGELVANTLRRHL